ncbi:MAG: nuclease [Burkholderiaceae bacterium]
MTTLRIATINCLNLALAGRRTYDGFAPYTPDEYIAKTQWLAALLDRLAADFVLVQEVFHEQALSDVVRQTASRGRAFGLAAPLADENNTQPRLALVWRLPWQPRVQSIVDLPPGCAVPVPERGEHTQFSRPLLRATVGLPNGAALTLLNVHLKSRRPEYADGEDRADPHAEARAQLRSLIIRGAEAAALRSLVVEWTRNSRAPLVVAGDFNDAPGAVTTRIVADTSWTPDDRPQRDCMLFDVLDVVRRPVPRMGRDVAYTVMHGGEPERIDHLLVSEAFVAHSKHAIGHVASVEILADHLVERRRAALEAADPNGTDLSRIFPDHAAVCASIVLDGQ